MPTAAPENTLEGFATAHANGATWIEFDVRPCGGGSRDDLVVHHDPVTANGLHVATTSRRALGQQIPTLRQVLETCGATLGLDIELKTDDIGIELEEFVDRTLHTLDQYAGAVDRSHVVVTSFDAEALAMIRATDTPVHTGLLFHKRSMDWAIETAVEHGHSVVAPWHPLVSEKSVQRAHEAGLNVATWTVNTRGQIEAVAKAGVDMIIGDDSALIAEVLNEGR